MKHWLHRYDYLLVMRSNAQPLFGKYLYRDYIQITLPAFLHQNEIGCKSSDVKSSNDNDWFLMKIRQYKKWRMVEYQLSTPRQPVPRHLHNEAEHNHSDHVDIMFCWISVLLQVLVCRSATADHLCEEFFGLQCIIRYRRIKQQNGLLSATNTRANYLPHLWTSN
jgi:hypothetical protein